nr:hypothetical protein Iba_chr01eCG7990 [Ipomoea batatas]
MPWDKKEYLQLKEIYKFLLTSNKMQKTMISTYSFRGSIELGAISSDDTGKRHESYFLDIEKLKRCLDKREVP